MFRVIAERDRQEIARALDSLDDELAVRAISVAATRHDTNPYFLAAIRHDVYAGDTALHIAAAAHQRTAAESLVGSGAQVRARNRRGAEPLHYAAGGSPGETYWDPAAQRDVIHCFVAAGADPNARDHSGVAPLHRAIRTRSADAVRALLANGADPLTTNKRGSTPLDLATHNTGRSGSGSAAAKEQQREIIELLVQHGAHNG